MDSEQVKTIIEDVITEESFWDLGVPKGSSEFLVYGSAHSVKPVRGLGVFVRVSNSSKFLMVFGDREWTDFGISEAKPFKTMPIDYEHAFGGGKFSKNPLGKGFFDAQQCVLPNIESSDELITNREDIPDNVMGLKPYPLDWVQRQQYFVEYGGCNMDLEIIPDDALPEHFNVAPPDQRLNGFFIGNEEIELKNMHPFKPLIRSSLPGVRLRMFAVHQNDSNKQEFIEISVTCETLFLLPEWERGVLIFRSVMETLDLQASNVSYVYSALELLSEQAKPLEFYYQAFLSRLPKNSNVVVENSQISDGEECLSPIEPKEDFNAKLKEIFAQFNKEEAGIRSFFAILNNLDALNFANDDGLIKNIFFQLNEVLRQANVTEMDFIKYAESRKEEGKSILPSDEEIINSLKEGWKDDANLYERLKQGLSELEKLKAGALVQDGS